MTTRSILEKRESIAAPHAAPSVRAGLFAAFGVALLGFGGGAFADGGALHQNEQGPPIALGATGGNINDITKAFCCSGTLGGLVVDSDGTEYILSNNHVLALTNKGAIGDFIIHPGLIDARCGFDLTQPVATLADFIPISFEKGAENTVDAAIAATVPFAVSNVILDIETVGTTTMSPSLGLDVKKSGRTTGLTVGQVAAVDVTADVSYWRECGKGNQKARFVNQIRITPGSFSAGGDSGSLIVENAAPNPRPVGLLFAGSDTTTLANPIGRVFECLGVAIKKDAVPTMIDCAAAGGGEETDGGGPPPGKGPKKKSSTHLPPGLEVASEVKARHEDRLFAIRGVVGTGISVDEAGAPVIEVYVDGPRRDRERAIPERLEGIPVRVIETGPFIAH